MVIRELFAKLGLDVNAQSFAKGQLAVEGVKFALGKLIHVAEQAIHGFVASIEGIAKTGAELEEASQSTGMTTDALQELRSAALYTGIEAHDLDTYIFRLSRNMLSAASGSGETGKAFKKLGIHVTDTNGKLVNADETIMALADKFSKMEDGTEKAGMAQEIFGRSGAHIIPMLNLGREGIEKYRRSAVKMGEDEIKAAKSFEINMRKMSVAGKLLQRELFSPLLPEINKILKSLTDWIFVNKKMIAARLKPWMSLFLNGMMAIGKTVKTVIIAVDSLIKNWKFLAVTAIVLAAAIASSNIVMVASFIRLQAVATWAAIKTAASWALAALPFVAIGLAIGALFLIFDDLRVAAKGGNSLFGLWHKELDEWWGNEREGGDPWWLKAIKGFTFALKDLMEGTLWEDFMAGLHYLHGGQQELDEWTQKRNGSVMSSERQKKYNEQRMAKGFAPLEGSQIEQAEQLFREEKESREGGRKSFSWYAQHPKADPLYTATPSNESNMSINNIKMEMNISVPEGQSPKDFADAAYSKWNSEMSDAKASFSY